MLRAWERLVLFIYEELEARSLQPARICPSCCSRALCGRTGRVLSLSLTGKLSFEVTYLENVIVSSRVAELQRV